MKHNTSQHPILWIHLQKDTFFLERDAAANGKYTKAAVAAIQRKVSRRLVCETTDFARAQITLKILRIPGSKRFILRKQGERKLQPTEGSISCVKLF